MLKKADLYPTNPRWTIDYKETGSTWKTVILTVGIIVASFFMSYGDIQNLWIPTSALTVTEAYVAGGTEAVDSFIVGASLTNPAYYNNVVFQYSSG